MTPPIVVPLEFRCHVRPKNTARVQFVIDKKVTVVDLEPTINWVMGSTADSSHTVKFLVPVGQVDFCITAKNSDVIICGYAGSQFNYATQPVWSDGNSFMDITGHGADQDLQGPGSLVLPDGVTVTFTATVQTS